MSKAEREPLVSDTISKDTSDHSQFCVIPGEKHQKKARSEQMCLLENDEEF